MAIDRSGRVLAASILFLLAVLLVINYVVNGAELLTYGLPLGLAFFGLLVLFVQAPKRGSLSAKASDENADTPAQSASNIREYLPPAPVTPEMPTEPVAELPAAVEDIPRGTEPATEAEADVESIPYTLLRDDLAVIDGIGPKIAGALYDAGITTYGKLAEETPESLRAVLTAAGVRVVGRVEASLPTWPHQARYASHGDFPGLMRYIADHKRSSSED